MRRLTWPVVLAVLLLASSVPPAAAQPSAATPTPTGTRDRTTSPTQAAVVVPAPARQTPRAPAVPKRGNRPPPPTSVVRPNFRVAHSPTTSTTQCSTVRSRLRELAASGTHTATCIGQVTGERPAPGSRSGPATLSAFPDPQQRCADDVQIDIWYYGREWFCKIIFGQQIDTYETVTGNVVGQAVYTINHASGLDPFSGTWSNFTSFFLQSQWGDAAKIVDSANYCLGCSGSSLEHPFSGQTRVPLQQAVTVTNDFMCAEFVADPQVANDSCDEFPFASSYQNGNMLGLSPSQCAEVFPSWVGAPNYWEFFVSEGYSTSQRCGIGHVTLSHNQSTGGAYGVFIQNNRVLDADPFWLTW